MNFGPASSIRSITKVQLLLLGLCLLLFIGLRLQWIGHLLMWDEAMNLCTVRSYAAQGEDPFSAWFFTHPPLFCFLMLFLKPFQTGFAERVEIMAVLIGSINLLLLFVLNRRIFSTRVALWSVFCLSALPASVFFDVWIKRDHLVPTFGIPAILFFLSGKPIKCGIFLGLALLSKETAAFYVLCVGILWCVKADGQRRVKDLLAITLITFFMSGWWYLIVNFQSVMRNVGFVTEGNNKWLESHWYYFANLHRELGLTGLVLAVAGVVALTLQFVNTRSKFRDLQQQASTWARLWPLILILPNYLLLSLIQNKVAWVVIVLLPAWATLQGIGMSAALDYYRNVVIEALRADVSPIRKTLQLTIPAAVSSAVVMLLVFPVMNRDYVSTMLTTIPGQWYSASKSLDAAETMNRLVQPGERALITSFHYWEGVGPRAICPVFTYYFEKNIEVMIRPFDSTFEDLVDDIKQFEIDWVLVSPQPGPKAMKVFGGFTETLKLEPIKLQGSYLFRTSEVR